MTGNSSPLHGTRGDDEAARALRQLAEGRLQTDAAVHRQDDLAHSSPDAVQLMLHELRVHQIELEMQNEELRRVQLDLEVARARWFDLYDMAPVGHCTVSASGLIVQANLTLATLCGVARSGLVNRPFSQYVLADDQDTYYVARRQIIADGAPQSYDLRMTRANEPSWYAHLMVTVAEDEHGAVELHIAVSDVSARKRAEAESAVLQRQLNQAQKLESIGRLAGGVAHDFNNMLSVILGHCELTLANAETPPWLRSDLTAIQTAAQRSADVTRQLLAFAREQSVRPSVIDLNATLTRSLRLLKRLIGDNIGLTWHPAADVWPVLVDARQVDQILANLCVNARDAIKGTGTMVVATGNRVVTAAQCTEVNEAVPGEYVMLSVTDSGCGMTDEVRAHIFEPFFTTKDVGEGTGLGLASVHGAVRQNHGFIDVASAPGVGTTFKVCFPRYTGDRREVQRAEVTDPMPRGHETILVVEDEAALRRMVVVSLEAQGYTVFDADGPREAMRLFKAHGTAISLVLTDVLMPEMSGNELAATFTAEHPSLKVLFMSGYPADALEVRVHWRQPESFIAKPFSLGQLRRKVRDVLDRA
jgi:PAS domain S-box-containing protein